MTAAWSIGVFLLGSMWFVSGALAQDSAGEPGRDVKKPNPLKNVYFGEQHLHTQNSFDAFTIGTRASWADAYDYVKGKN